jgi:hypothetical protein
MVTESSKKGTEFVKSAFEVLNCISWIQLYDGVLLNEQEDRERVEVDSGQVVISVHAGKE